jgi:hypothetical protein
LIHKAFYTLCDTVQKVGTFSATYKTIKYQSGIVSKLARYLLGNNQAKIKGHTMRQFTKQLMAYCNKSHQEHLIGYVSCKTIHGDICGTIHFISARHNELFPRIKTIISHPSDYDIIINNMIAALDGRYSDFTMSEFIRVSNKMPEFLALNS